MASWTYEDGAAARREGWDLFETDQGSLQIQRLDDVDAWRAEGVEVQRTWTDDTDVWEYVVTETSPLHEKAVEIIQDANPEEYQAMRRWVARGERLVSERPGFDRATDVTWP